MNVKGRIRAAFLNDHGLRSGWKMARNTAVYLAVFYGAIFGLAALFGALFSTWGLTTDNLQRAPLWARQVVIWHTDFSYALAYVLSGLAGVLLTRRRVRGGQGSLWMGVGLGVLIASLLTAIAVGFDCMRMERPLSEPVLSASQLASAAVLILGKLSGEILTKRILFEGAKRRIVGYTLVCVATFLLIGAWTGVAAAVNAVLAAIVGCALYEHGGLAASSGFQCALYLWLGLIFGWPGLTVSVSPVYALYHVSDAWLTGGASGVLNGWGLAIMLTALAVVLLRREIQNVLRRMLK